MNSLDQDSPDILSGLIWITTVRHADGIPERFLFFLEANMQMIKKYAKLSNMQRVNLLTVSNNSINLEI